MEVAGEVFIGAVVDVPVGVKSEGGGVGDIVGVLMVLFRLEHVVEALLTVERIVAILGTDLAGGIAPATIMTTPTMTFAAVTKTTVPRATTVLTTTMVFRGLLRGSVVTLVANLGA
jgi:hypothetical protein